MVNIERVKTKHGKKTIIKMPVRYAYYEADDVTADNEEYSFTTKKQLPELIDLKTATSKTAPDLKAALRKQVLCNVHFNAEDNPVNTEFINRMRVFTAIQYISILEYKKTKNAVFTFLESQVCYVKSKGRVFNRKPVAYQLTVRNDGKTTLTKNGKAMLSNVAIEGFFAIFNRMVARKYLAKHRGYAVLKRLFIKYFLQNKLPLDGMEGNEGFDRIGYRMLTKVYRVKQNPKLGDLPWDIYDIANIYDHTLAIPPYANSVEAKAGERSVTNVKVSLNRYLRRGDTKKAVRECFYGYEYPKSINKVLFQTKPLEFPYSSYRNIRQLIDRLGVNIARNMITNDDGTPDYAVINNLCIIDMLDIGFSVREIKKTNYYECSDTLRIRETLLGCNITLEFMPKIKEYHDYLVDLWTAERRAARERSYIEHNEAMMRRKETRGVVEAAYREVDTSDESLAFTVNGFTFRTPASTHELREVGASLSICVSYEWYLRSFYLSNINIVLITKPATNGSEKYIACLELRGNNLVQAKLNSNRFVASDKEVFKATKEWVAANDITLACEDMGAKDRRVPLDPTNKKRLEIGGFSLEQIMSLEY